MAKKTTTKPKSGGVPKAQAKSKSGPRAEPESTPNPKDNPKPKPKPKPNPRGVSGREAGSGPVLLSGGNPQIPKGDGDAPVQAYIAAMPGWKGDVGRRIDGLVGRAAPGVRKAVRWNTPFYGVEGEGWFLAFHCITRYVKVAFLNGTSLTPMPPVASKNEGTRYLHIHEGEPIDEAQFVEWVRQASGMPGEKCF